MKDWYESYVNQEEEDDHDHDHDDWQTFKEKITPLKTKPYHELVFKTFVKVQKHDLSLDVIKTSKTLICPFSRVQRRKFMPEKTIDLHGMTQHEALLHLTKFIEISWNQGYKALLVITGKGSLNKATLRTSFPVWAKDFPLNQWIVSLTQARSEHGGQGSFYVLLKTKKRL